ncbi:MAG: 8-amino-7-oxononanoate synthase [Deltaproteobacteria bacterium]|nr:8-amino-7-oxononanoate synthase [Deltaproteobacteria bacterium]
MLSFYQKHLNQLKTGDQFRSLKKISSPQERILSHQGKDYLNFASNNYLGLANHPKIKAAMIEGVERYGVGAGASRLINGSLQPFHDLEKKIARWKNSESALLFNSGYQANLGVLSCLLQEGDLILSDELNHASMIDGMRLSKAKKKVYPHFDLDVLKSLLQEARQEMSADQKILIVTESVFSMEGDIAPLQEILDLAEEFDAWIYLDEAHAVGVLGAHGAGLAETLWEHPAFSTRLIQMGTLGKALGCFGAYIAASQVLIDFLINHTRTFIFATALPPAVACAASQALEILQEESERRERLWSNMRFFQEAVSTLKLAQGISVQSPIVPVIVGENQKALEMSQKLFQQGFWVTAIRPPTVPVGKARLRLTLMSDHQKEDIKSLVEFLNFNKDDL